MVEWLIRDIREGFRSSCYVKVIFHGEVWVCKEVCSFFRDHGCIAEYLETGRNTYEIKVRNHNRR